MIQSCMYELKRLVEGVPFEVLNQNREVLVQILSVCFGLASGLLRLYAAKTAAQRVLVQTLEKAGTPP
jgi:hypothetical protein